MLPRTKYTSNSVVVSGSNNPSANHGTLSLSCTYLPSDPNLLLEYMASLASDDSHDDFDGYLLSDEDPELVHYLHYIS